MESLSDDLVEFVTELRTHGLTGPYVKKSLEDLGTDQLKMEDDLEGLNRRLLIAAGLGLTGIGVGLLSLKAVKQLIGGMSQLGAAVLATQQAVGLSPGMAVPMPEASPDPEDAVKLRVVENPPDAVNLGAVYDPGPQPGPEGPLPEVPTLDEPL